MLQEWLPESPYRERSEFEKLAAGGGIAFERNDLVPYGQAVLACDPWAACVIMSAATADRLTLGDDQALWVAIAAQEVSRQQPVVVNLPIFGGGGLVEAIPESHPARCLSSRAVDRARTFLPYDGRTTDENGDYYFFDPDEDVRSHWTENPPYYRRFLKTNAARIRWLDDLRTRLVEHLVSHCVVHEPVEQFDRSLKIRRWAGGGGIINNEDGGRAGKIRHHPVLEARRNPVLEARRRQGHPGYLEFLVLADELDRRAAVEVLASEGIDLPFDPVPGWLNASVEPGLHGRLDVHWSGQFAGLDLKPEAANHRDSRPHLATFHIDNRTLHVFASQLADPIERLLRRVGQPPARTVVEPHPYGTDYVFGADIVDIVQRSRLRPRTARKLRDAARELIPAPWAEQLEKAWSPPAAPQIDIPPGLFGRATAEPARQPLPPPSTARAGASCRLCTSSSSGTPYCAECVKDAEEGLFHDAGFDEDWKGAVLWSLQTLAAVEFGGPPARSQLKKPPADGDNADLLMLCRMLTARHQWTAMGSDRKAHAWTDWLAQAGLLTDGLRTSRGVAVMAKDGHICRSLLEREIDDFLYENGIHHEQEPDYPFDPQHNVSGYRADWKLADGTFVEALGFPNKPEYMAKAERKIALAAMNGIPVVTVTSDDIPQLPSIFAKWLPPENERVRSGGLPPRPNWPQRKKAQSGASTGKNDTNIAARSQRLQRCREAVELQAGGASRKQIAATFAVTTASVAALLRDGKFYADPTSDPVRLGMVKEAAAAQYRGMTRVRFRVEKNLSAAKADEVWRDADVIFGNVSQAES